MASLIKLVIENRYETNNGLCTHAITLGNFVRLMEKSKENAFGNNLQKLGNGRIKITENDFNFTN